MDPKQAISFLRSLLVTDDARGHALSLPLKVQAQEALGIIEAALPVTANPNPNPKRSKKELQ